jgi:Fe-S-cluster containining protein
MNRKERRRQAKLGGQGGSTGAAASADGFAATDALAWLQTRRAPAVAPPARTPAEAPLTESAIANRVQFQVMDVLRSSAAVAEAAAAARGIAEEIWAAQRPIAEARKRPGFACAAGCAWCCYQQVSVAPAEAIAIAEHIRATFAPAAMAALQSRLAALDAKTRGLGQRGRAELKTACAFLIEGTCSIYPVRPLRCRGVYSRDAEHCRWAMENPGEIFGNRERHGKPGPYPVEPAKIMDAALTGLSRACAERQLGWQALELTAAVCRALEEPDLPERYWAGEAVFAGAELPDRD